MYQSTRACLEWSFVHTTKPSDSSSGRSQPAVGAC